MIIQSSFPNKAPWWSGDGDLAGYRAPDRSKPRLDDPTIRKCKKAGTPLVTVIGTICNEAVPFARSWQIWRRQVIPDWLTVQFVVIDEGSTDDGPAYVRRLIADGAPIRLVRTAEPGAVGERSCTLAFNAVVRQLVKSPLVWYQWWDRIPGSFHQAAAMVEPFRTECGISVNGTCRHLGGSASTDAMGPAQLASLLDSAPWQADPSTLATIAGTPGNHVVPGRCSESGSMVLPTAELVAVGGWDERYTERASYVNVELFRRLFQAGLRQCFVDPSVGSNFHQSHPCPLGREKKLGWLHERAVRRNAGIQWGSLPILEVYP